MHNWRRYPSSNWYEIDQKRGSKFGALLWRHLTPQRNTAIQGHNYNPSIQYNCSKKMQENLLTASLLVRTILFIPSRFWTTDTKFDTCCQISYRQRMQRRAEKNLYRCTSTVSALNYCSRIFSNSSAICTKWCTQTFPPIFGLFAIFDRNLVKIVAPPSDECELCTPRTHGAPDLERDKQKNKLETKASSDEGQCIPAGSSVSLRPIFHALQNFERNFANLVAPPTHISAKSLVRCKEHLVL